MTIFTTGDGNTPLSPEEQDDLIPDLTTKEELNEWERQNILEAYTWALEQRNLNRQDPFAEAYVREMHLRMFDQTWKWAGIYRTTEKNIGIPHYQIREALAVLLGDARYWVEHQTFEPDELAIRFHHRLVLDSSVCEWEWSSRPAYGRRHRAETRQAGVHVGRRGHR
jgi:Fic-DOC domain mobile mystery protein B